MKFAAVEGQHPLEDLDWSEHYNFPRELILVGFVSHNLPVIIWNNNVKSINIIRYSIYIASTYLSLVEQVPSDVSVIWFSGVGGATAVQNYRQLTADLQIPGVPWDGGCTLLCHELRPGECGQSHGQKQRGRRNLFSAELIRHNVFFLKTCSLWTVLRLLNSVTLSWSFQAVVPIYQGNVFTLMSNISVPSKESELTNFMVKQEGGMSCLRLFLLCWTVTVWVFFFVNKCDVIFFSAKHEDWKAAKLIVSKNICHQVFTFVLATEMLLGYSFKHVASLQEHKRVFERMWLGFLKYKVLDKSWLLQ